MGDEPGQSVDELLIIEFRLIGGGFNGNGDIAELTVG
jgi:hypothetical protein